MAAQIDKHDDCILFEIEQRGNALRVTALDPVSCLEATVLGPAHGSFEAIKMLAVRKLKYLLERRLSAKL